MQGSREKITLPSGHSFRVLRWARDLSHVDSVLGPNASESIIGEGDHWHYHSEMELTLFTSGDGTRFVGDHIGPFGTGDIVLLGEKLPHYWHTEGRSAGLSIQWNFPHGHPFWSFPETLALAVFFERAGRGIRFLGPTAATISRGLHEISRTDGPDRLGLLLRLMALMASAPASDQRFLSARSFSLPSESIYQKAMSDAVRYLLANFRDEIPLEVLLSLTSMSKPTFSRQFKKHSGKTFRDFLTHIRLQAVCRVLRETDHSILDCAFASGFGQVSFFNRIFRRLMQCSPSEYRAQQNV
jgi:AraC-like DNA-binding protein